MDYSIFDFQKEYVRSGQTQSPARRKATLRTLRDLLKANEQRLYEAVRADFGKSEFDTYATELGMIYEEIDYFLGHLGRLCRPRRVRTNLLNLPGRSRIYREPLGSVLIIGAWNYPYQLSLLPAVDALAAGNACTVKPSELAPHSMHLMAELINNGFTPDTLHVEEGGPEHTGELLKYPFDKIFFTGSTRVGRIVSEAAALNLTPVTLELGGKSPTVVTASADLDRAARRIVWGKWLNAGQTCVAPDYLLVDQKIVQRLLQRVTQQLDHWHYTDGAAHYVRIINRTHFDRLKRLINPQQVIYGGSSNAKTLYIEPTVLTDVGWDDPIMSEEIFGPILPILTYTDFRQTVERLRRMPKPLAAYLFSNDRREQRLFVERLPFGGGSINDTVMHLTNAALPFGGVGSSGIGRYHGAYGFDCFSHQKSVFQKPLHGEPALKYPPYSTHKLRWIKRFL